MHRVGEAYTRSNNAQLFYSLKDSIVVYRKSERIAKLREPRTEKSNSIYANPDSDPRGPWTSSSYVNPATKAERPNLVYPIKNPHTGQVVEHPTHAWKYEIPEHERHVRENLLWWGQSNDAKYPRLKNFLSATGEEGLVPIDLWDHESSGTTDDGGAEVKDLFDGHAVFDNPKPTKLIRRMIQLCCNNGDPSIILDFFAGSGSTAHAVMAHDVENRRKASFHHGSASRTDATRQPGGIAGVQDHFTGLSRTHRARSGADPKAPPTIPRL